MASMNFWLRIKQEYPDIASQLPHRLNQLNKHFHITVDNSLSDFNSHIIATSDYSSEKGSMTFEGYWPEEVRIGDRFIIAQNNCLIAIEVTSINYVKSTSHFHKSDTFAGIGAVVGQWWFPTDQVYTVQDEQLKNVIERLNNIIIESKKGFWQRIMCWA